MPVEYANRPGIHNVAVVAVPTLTGNRLVHLSVDSPPSWKIRDYIRRQILSSSDSNLSSTDIEDRATHCEERDSVLGRGVTHPVEWREYLVERSRHVFGDDYDGESPPDADAGQWRPL